jgi:hypothetical protein
MFIYLDRSFIFKVNLDQSEFFIKLCIQQRKKREEILILN